MEEKALIARVRSGDAAAERELYQRHVDRVYRLAYRMAGDEVIAQDITQDTFIRAFDRVHDFRGDAAFGTWLHAIATTVALNTLRKVKRFRRREVDLDEAKQYGSADGQPDPTLKAKLEHAIDELPERYRAVFLMHEVEGYKHDEIAASLGMKVGSSKALLSRARARLRESLAEFAQEWVS